MWSTITFKFKGDIRKCLYIQIEKNQPNCLNVYLSINFKDLKRKNHFLKAYKLNNFFLIDSMLF